MNRLYNLIHLLDLTYLDTAADEQTIKALCAKAQTPYGPVAAVCVYPKYVALAKRLLKDTTIKLCTVVNFPSGQDALDTTLGQIRQALADGADEIDMVLPYQAYLNQDKQEAIDYVKACRQHIPAPMLLKVILETGALNSPILIAEAAHDMLAIGADFLKTSTGKTATGASLEAAAVMLSVMAETNPDAGFKVSGGIRTPEQALQYVRLARHIFPSQWVNPSHFRIGASGLLDTILQILSADH